MARTRSSPRRKAAAVASVANDIDFPHLWRQLRAAGWTAKRSSGLENEWKYASPDGTHVFVGTSALVAHVVHAGLLDVAEDDSASLAATMNSTAATTTSSVGASLSGDVFTTNESAAYATPIARRARRTNRSASPAYTSGARAGKKTKTSSSAALAPATATPAATITSTPSATAAESLSQIDTSMALSQGTLNVLFGSQDVSEVDVELSQAAVPRAFGLSPSALLADTSGHEAAFNLQQLSEVSGHESEEEEEKVETPARHLSRPNAQVHVKHDVNFLPDDENSSDYESFESEDSESEDVVEDTDDEPVRVDQEADDDALSERDAIEMDEAFITSLMIGDDTLRGVEKKQREEALRGTEWTPVSSAFEGGVSAYAGMDNKMAHPVAELRALTHSPLLTFFYFMPKSLWVKITTETNRYSLQQVDRRAQVLRSKQRGDRVEPLQQIRRRLKLKREYETHELLQVIGLLVARMLCPQKRRFADHWSMTEDGAVPAGSFGRFMGRNRCTDILRDLHFVDNEAVRNRDKLWKLRPIIDKLQQSFLAGWSLPAVFSFDEGVLPSTSRRNTTRMFMPDKPHRYGSKMFMTCDSRTAYCHRFELYAGKRDVGDSTDSPFDHKTGAAAVVRNLKAILGSGTRYPWHAVVVDRFYTSVLLALELLGMGVYMVGTIMASRLGYDKNVKESRQTRPASIQRGSFTFSRSVAVPTMVAFHWWDRKPVHYLCTGATMEESSIGRKIKQVGAISIPCPAAVTDYQRWMGGVDVHDQLRLQRFSLQTSTKFKKYYKSLFLGFVDMALVNAYLSHKEAAQMAATPAMKRGEWFGVLQNQLLQLKPHDFAGVVATPTITGKKRKRARVSRAHAPEQSEDWVIVSGVQKRRQRSCKVCALLRTDSTKKSYSTTFFCERCSLDDAKMWLCNKIRREFKGAAKTCFEIWHDDFGAGEDIPPTLGKRVVLRRPGKKAGARRKTRRELQLRADGGDDESDSEDSDDSRDV